MKLKSFLLILFILISQCHILYGQELSIKSRPVKLNISEIKDGRIAKVDISNILFEDSNYNDRLDAGETAKIKFYITNSGDGTARSLNMKVVEKKLIKGLKINYNKSIGDLRSDESIPVIISIESDLQIQTGTVELEIIIEEINGFSKYTEKNPQPITFKTLEFKKPELLIVEHEFTSPDKKNGEIGLAEKIDLRVVLQNIGQGYANEVELLFTLDKNVLPLKGESFYFKKITPGEAIECTIQFIANNNYNNDVINVDYEIQETYNKYGSNGKFPISINTELEATPIIIAGEQWKETTIIKSKIHSDVDYDFPVNKKIKNRYAIIIGNEDYTSHQGGLSSEQNVEFAENDAKIFKEYTLSSLGVEEDNLYYLINATAGQMKQKIELVTEIIKEEDENSELIFYYAGHGYPDQINKTPYLIPVDINANDLNSAINLNQLYIDLSNSNASRITVFLDACFTGGARSQGLVASRGIKISPKQGDLNGNIIVFSASNESQSSLPYYEKNHGMFTYFLLKKLQKSKGKCTYEELYNYLSDEVSLNSLKINEQRQDPKVNISIGISNDWKNWTF
jgi:hypothetical protein